MDDKKNQNQINIELNEDIAQGKYANLAIITHSSSEFVVDFVRVMPGVPKAKVNSRIILTPEHAKRLMLALQENIKKFESLHGPIKNIDTSGGIAMPLNFGGPTAEA
ncbi:MAG: DUF3467 domain-containing protein [Bacteroidetes bacterium]|nr:MAG: DUF3467 domain-containing protein [Bacteroidota bacterium]